MNIIRAVIVACTVLMVYATNVVAFNHIYLRGKGVGGEMSCSDWNRVTAGNEKAAMMQWVFGFITGYDAANRPNFSAGSLNGQRIANLIVERCKDANEDLISVATYISMYVQRVNQEHLCG